MEVWARLSLACLAIAVVASPAHAFQVASHTPFELRQSRSSACSARTISFSAVVQRDSETLPADIEGGRGAARAQGLSRRIFVTSAVVVGSALWVAPAQAGTVMVGGGAVAAEEELDDEVTGALEGAGGGPLDFILSKVNFKKLGFWGATFLAADTASGLVMGNSFFKIVRGKEDPEDWKTKVVDKYFGKPGDGKQSPSKTLDFGAGAMDNSADLDTRQELATLVSDKINSNKVMVFSKTRCPFCKNAKAALDAQGISYEVMELDTRADGQDIQDIMLQLTGARSVPRVFINGKFIGGGDDTCALAASGKLKALVEAV